MGKQWDRLEENPSKYGRSQSSVGQMKSLYGDAKRAQARQHDWHLRWLTEAYRVLRPGGIIKAFSGTRTFHRLALAMEQAGFDLLPMETWNYGSGFPKSHNISLALDKDARGHPHGGRDPNKRAQSGSLKFEGAALATNRTGDGTCGLSKNFDDYLPATEAAQRWKGWGTALKPAWEPVLVGRKPDAS